MTTKAAIMLVALMALMASSMAVSSDENQKIIEDTAPLTAIESVVVGVGNRKFALMVLQGSQPNCITEGNTCGAFHLCCPGLYCYGAVAIFSGTCLKVNSLASTV